MDYKYQIDRYSMGEHTLWNRSKQPAKMKNAERGFAAAIIFLLVFWIRISTIYEEAPA
jgi:hypothetical protein